MNGDFRHSCDHIVIEPLQIKEPHYTSEVYAEIKVNKITAPFACNKCYEPFYALNDLEFHYRNHFIKDNGFKSMRCLLR